MGRVYKLLTPDDYVNEVYLGSPYTHPDKEVRRERWEQACRAAAWLRSRCGFSRVFSPVAHCHPITELGGGGVEFDSWSEFDLAQLIASRVFARLLIDGWMESEGLEIETLKAMENRLIIFDMLPVDDDYAIGLWLGSAGENYQSQLRRVKNQDNIYGSIFWDREILKAEELKRRFRSWESRTWN